MKFGKLMGRAEEVLPDLKLFCFRYKEMKKQLKALYPGEPSSTDDVNRPSSCISREAEERFMKIVSEDVKKLNEYFCDKEEEVVINLQQVDEQYARASTLEERQICHIGYIHLHGQLVLLFHWSMLNYAALAKIIKKHDKLSGLELKHKVLEKALRQPFSTTHMLSGLMAKCESRARELDRVTGGLDPLLNNCPQYEGLFLVKETEAALDLLTELRSNVKTPSTFPAPPQPLLKRQRVDDGDVACPERTAAVRQACCPTDDGEDDDEDDEDDDAEEDADEEEGLPQSPEGNEAQSDAGGASDTDADGTGCSGKADAAS